MFNHDYLFQGCNVTLCASKLLYDQWQHIMVQGKL